MHKGNSRLFYLTTGFHRSGTSLVAQTLTDNGIHMGDELMGASFSNPLGHVEDMPIVRLHDKVLKLNGTDWRHCDQFGLVKPNWLTNYLHSYMQDKQEKHAISAVKDPRAVFFLNDWSTVGRRNIRFIFVYRHWSTACNSLFNRHSRHLINSIHPMQANKLNISFWQQPDLAFDMWLASNKRLLDFYLAHPKKCLLISQEALVRGECMASFTPEKIGLSSEHFLSRQYQASLMTDKVSESVLNVCSQAKQKQLKEVWGQLQAHADLASPSEPEVEKEASFVIPPKISTQVRPDCTNGAQQRKFDTSQLTWEELSGFLVHVPQHMSVDELFYEVIKRPFGSSECYQDLAKVAHRNHLILLCKLLKMRAMQTHAASWDVRHWRLYQEDDLSDIDVADLPKANPFSLRQAAESSHSNITLGKQQLLLPWKALQGHLHALSSESMKEILDYLLLHRQFTESNEYQDIANIAARHNLLYLAEFAQIKALRLSFNATALMELSDIYRRQAMFDAAEACLSEADRLNPDSPAIKARLADIFLAKGELEQAQKLINAVTPKAPANPVIKKCRRQLLVLQQKAMGLSPLETAKRKYLMPGVGHYEQIVELMRQDHTRGRMQDHRHRQVAFILRDNLTWLAEGLATVPKAAQQLLCVKICQHWQDLWPTEVLAAEIGLASDRQTSRLALEPLPASPLKLAISLAVTDLSTLPELLAFIQHAPQNADILIFCEPQQQAQVQKAIEQHSLLNLKFLAIPPQSLGGRVEFDLTSNYDLVCRLHSLHEQMGLIGWRLQLLYCLLGDLPGVTQTICAFEDDPQLGVVLPPYHPALLTLPTRDFALHQIVACGNMYWYRPKALAELELNSQDLSRFGSASIPLAANEAGYAVKFSHLL